MLCDGIRFTHATQGSDGSLQQTETPQLMEIGVTLVVSVI